jgi:sphingosine kinase
MSKSSNNSCVTREPYEDNPILVSTLNLVWHTVLPMDLMLVQTPARTYCSFLSVGYGLLADIDIESERLRMLGESRFTVWAFARLASAFTSLSLTQL